MRTQTFARRKYTRITIAKEIISRHIPFWLTGIDSMDQFYAEVSEALKEGAKKGVLIEVAATLRLSVLFRLPGTPTFRLPKTKEVYKLLGKTKRFLKKGGKVSVTVVL